MEVVLAQFGYSDLVIERLSKCISLNGVKLCSETFMQENHDLSEAAREAIENVIRSQSAPADDQTWQECNSKYTSGEVAFAVDPRADIFYAWTLTHGGNDPGAQRVRGRGSISLVDVGNVWALRLGVAVGVRLYHRQYLGPNDAVFEQQAGTQMNYEVAPAISPFDFHFHVPDAGMMALSFFELGFGVEFAKNAPVSGQDPQVNFEFTPVAFRWAPLEARGWRNLYGMSMLTTIHEAPASVRYTGTEPVIQPLDSRYFWYAAIGAGYEFN
jgi:hypothetical protein